MTRRSFSFHYERDIWRTNIMLRNSGVVEGTSAAGFHDASLWEEAKKKGDAEVKKLIDKGLVGTSVTVVLIGAEPLAGIRRLRDRAEHCARQRSAGHLHQRNQGPER